MKKSNLFRLALVLFLFPSFSSLLFSQMPQRGGSQVRVTGWADDNNYFLQTVDSENRPVTRKVNARNGRSVDVIPEKSEREAMNEELPSGVALGLYDIVSADRQSAVLSRDNDLYFFRKGDRELKRLTSDDVEEVNYRFSPDGQMIAYTRNKDLYVYDLAEGREIRLSSDASDRIYNGYSSWVYMEEILDRPSRYAAFWWSPDGSRIAYLRTDETEVPVFTLNRLDEADGVHGLLEQVPYPKSGDPNPKVKMGIADIASGKTTWVKTDYNVDQYIAWPFWTPDSRKLAVQVINRDQNEMNIILADPATGDFSEIYNEKQKAWLDFYKDIYVMKDGSGFIVNSVRNGWENLYYYSWDNKLIAQLTSFDFRVTGIERVDEILKVIWFTATGKESTDNHLFRVGLDGLNLVQLTNGPGSHSASISPKETWFVDTWNNISSAGSIMLLDSRGKQVREIHKFEQPAYDPSRHSKAELLRIPTSDGLFSMPAIITYPLNFDPSKKYPVIFRIYGGPDSKNVNNRWQGTDPSWDSQNGIITFTVDHRGSGHFGKSGLDYLHRSLGNWEVLDYQDAVKWLLQKPYVDGSRMGITGSSYGGYMTCMALTRGAGYWTHGIAGSSVTDWRLYDNIYTERFMDTPQDNPEGYKDGSALTWAKNLTGKLYMTHGDLDDNVHMQNSIYLISRLQDEGKTFRFMLYPNGRHGWGGAKAVHSRNEANNFWLENFFGKE
ncbi:MAG TPA: S9 family peptidase [Bacteroidales bacterium]|nr:S9 family peptidase [Bacteroidales bacterium]